MAITWSEENARQESVNAWTHGMGFLISLPAGLFLHYLATQHRPGLVLACDVYSSSLLLLYLFSSLSHAIREPSARQVCRAFDQGFVYTLIAGTFTPLACSAMSGWSLAAFLLGVWIAAGVGFYSKVVARYRINNMKSISYILLGWIPSMILLCYVSWACFVTMAVGGVLYSLGTLFLKNDHRHWYYHAVWHVMVILASVDHYLAIVMFSVLQVD